VRVQRRLHVPDDLSLRARRASHEAEIVTRLTDEQAEAVARRREPLLLSAAAGSGKTSVLVERFVAAIRADGIAAGKILAITFTERAAGELRSRVRARLLELGDRDAARDTEAAYVGTFHGFCARLLRAHALAVGLDPQFTIMEEGLAGRLREQAFKEALREFLAGERSSAVDLLAAYGVDRVHTMVEQVYNELRSRGQRFPGLPEARPADDADVDPEAREQAEERAQVDADASVACVLLDELLQGYGLAYERLKHGRAAVDFDDLELLAGELLAEHENVRRAWSERFELVMVDEFQDTNARQLSILEALQRGNLFTVGDELQSIYGFRHADVSLFRARRTELHEMGGSLQLTRNFRSASQLLDVVNATFSERFQGYAPLVAGGLDTGGLDTARVGGADRGAGEDAVLGGAGRADGAPEVELLLTNVRGWEEREDLAEAIAAGLPHARLWRQAEARLLAQRVAELVQSGRARAGDVVVLLRASGDLEVFERALQLQGLRTLAAVGAFWGHQQIGDLISYLRALANPLDEVALYSVLASPLVGCSRDCLALLADAARGRRAGVWEAAEAACAGADGGLSIGLAAGDQAALDRFCVWLRDERASAPRRTISQLIERAIAASGYREHVLALDWGERRLANVHKLLRLARRFEASEGRDLRAFLDHVSYLEDAVKAEPDAPVEGVEPDAVRLMSIHAAKGLEFPVVCVADLGRRPNTQTPDLLVDGERVGLRLVRLDGAGSRPALDYVDLCSERHAREAEEEDRILYVAMTRARERMLLSGAVDFERWPTARQAPTAISWLAPALAADLPALAESGGPACYDLPIAGAGAGAGSATTVRCLLSSPATVGAVLDVGRLNRAADAAADQAERERQPPAGEQTAVDARAPAGEQLSLLAHDAPPAVLDTPSAVPDTQRFAVPHTQRSAVPHTQRFAVPDTQRSAVDTIATRAQKRASPARAPATPAPPAMLSYTSLTELERCGYRYYLERVVGLAEDRTTARTAHAHGGPEARARGTLIHRLLETLDFARPGPLRPEQVTEAESELGMRLSAKDREAIAALIEAARAAAPAARVAGARVVRREYPFAFSLAAEQPLISGVIDVLAQERDGTALVLDYKSDRVGPEVDLGALVEREYAIQRLLYALAVLRDGARAVEIVHWFLERPDDWVTARFQAAERVTLEGTLRAHVAAAARRGFAVSATPHRALCLTCPGRAGLCSWDDDHTLREDPALEAAAADPVPEPR
jgi:ATP-dependent exoDNAse (exonuclease V) beta subunit